MISVSTEDDTMSRCFIFGALEVGFYPEKPADGDLIIAADKGYDSVIALGLKPDITVGDFDSRGEIPDVESLIVLPVRKDATDVGYAAELGLERGYSDFVVYGAVGGMLDHTIGNIAIAQNIAAKGGRALFIGDEYTFTVIRDSSVSFAPRKGGRISVFALSDVARGVRISGLDYEAENMDLPRTAHIGVSNSFIGKPSCVSVNSGDLLIMYQSK